MILFNIFSHHNIIKSMLDAQLERDVQLKIY